MNVLYDGNDGVLSGDAYGLFGTPCAILVSGSKPLYFVIVSKFCDLMYILQLAIPKIFRHPSGSV